MTSALTLTSLREKAKARTTANRPRLVFGVDATGSREATWSEAQKLQAEMLRIAQSIGSLELQVTYFRGMNECNASNWSVDAAELAAIMAGIKCQSGATQIGRILDHTITEAKAAPGRVKCLVYVGDVCEEDPLALVEKAKELQALGVVAFFFQEGYGPSTTEDFTKITDACNGATASFNESAFARLRELITLAVAFATGGLSAMKKLPGAQLLISQMQRLGPSDQKPKE